MTSVAPDLEPDASEGLGCLGAMALLALTGGLITALAVGAAVAKATVFDANTIVDHLWHFRHAPRAVVALGVIGLLSLGTSALVSQTGGFLRRAAWLVGGAGIVTAYTTVAWVISVAVPVGLNGGFLLRLGCLAACVPVVFLGGWHVSRYEGEKRSLGEYVAEDVLG